jgi:hypothetical protein
VLRSVLQRADQLVNFLQNLRLAVVARNPALRIARHENRAAVPALDRLA